MAVAKIHACVHRDISLLPPMQKFSDAHRRRVQRRGGQTGQGARVFTHDAFEQRPRYLTLDQTLELVKSHAGRLKLLVALIQEPLNSLAVIRGVLRGGLRLLHIPATEVRINECPELGVLRNSSNSEQLRLFPGANCFYSKHV